MTGDVVWTQSGAALTGPTYSQTIYTKYSGVYYIYTARLAISAVRAEDAATITCTAQYQQGGYKMSTTIDMEIYMQPGNCTLQI